MTMDADDLERLVDRALGDLPTPRAPRTLRTRVHAAVAPPVGRPWFTWPRHVQAASGLLGLLAVAAFAWAWPVLVGQVSPSMPAVRSVVAVAETNAAVVQILRLTWAAVVAPLAWYLLVFIVMSGTACALCLAALSRVALGGASQS